VKTRLQARPRPLTEWCMVCLTTVALLSCAPGTTSVPAPTPFPTLGTVRSPAPTVTPVPAHATANALLLTAIVLENRGALPQAIEAAETALVVATTQPADATRAAGFLTRAPLRAGPAARTTQAPIVPRTATPGD
jgi:hypothetical protein